MTSSRGRPKKGEEDEDGDAREADGGPGKKPPKFICVVILICSLFIYSHIILYIYIYGILVLISFVVYMCYYCLFDPGKKPPRLFSNKLVNS